MKLMDYIYRYRIKFYLDNNVFIFVTLIIQTKLRKKNKSCF